MSTDWCRLGGGNKEIGTLPAIFFSNCEPALVGAVGGIFLKSGTFITLELVVNIHTNNHSKRSDYSEEKIQYLNITGLVVAYKDGASQISITADSVVVAGSRTSVFKH